MSITVTSRLHAMAVSCPEAGAPFDVIIVPAFSGRRELRMRTGMFFDTAGRIVLGWSTFAPKYASSEASANDRQGTTRGCGTMRGSAVSIPSTSVQIWISSASSDAPKIAAE